MRPRHSFLACESQNTTDRIVVVVAIHTGFPSIAPKCAPKHFQKDNSTTEERVHSAALKALEALPEMSRPPSKSIPGRYCPGQSPIDEQYMKALPVKRGSTHVCNDMGIAFVVLYEYMGDCKVKGLDTMSGREDKSKGKIDEFKGNAKENIGNAIGDDDMSREGRSDQSKGKGKQAVGNVKDAASDAKDAVKDKFRKND
jgi:uncharacterized protein YjbJ (UPF0337 family)